MNNEIVPSNLYELPKCSICLQEMHKDLSNLACGHIFHEYCIMQHFQYKGSCPYCQKRSIKKEIRPVLFLATPNTVASSHLMEVLESIDKSEGKQVEGLLKQIKMLSEKSQKFAHDAEESEKENKKKEKLIDELKSELNSKVTQVNQLLKDNHKIKKTIENNDKQIKELKSSELHLRIEVDKYIAERKEVQQYKRLQKQVCKNSQALEEYRKNLEKKGILSEQMCEEFYELLKLKNLQVRKNKEKIKQFKEKYEEIAQEFERAKENLKRQKERNDNLEKEKEELKKKFLKYKNSNSSQIQSVSQESMSLTSKHMLAKPQSDKQTSFNFVEKGKKGGGIMFLGNGLQKKKAETKEKTLKDIMK